MSTPATGIANGVAKPIHDLGMTFMAHGDTADRATANGYDAPAFYFAGRGGVLGDVDPDVVYAVFGWFAPHVVRPMWRAGIAVHGAQEAATRFFEACAAWGRDHLSEVEGLDRFASLALRVVGAAEPSGRPLFAAWRRQRRATDPPGKAMQLAHVLREWRAANHLVATTACALSPLEAVVAGGGPERARLLGWPDPVPAVTDDLRTRWLEAEALTDRLWSPPFEVLSPPEQEDFLAVTEAMWSAGSS